MRLWKKEKVEHGASEGLWIWEITVMFRKEDAEKEYRFMKEVIKKKPLDKRKLACTIGGLLAGAVLFGLVSAFVFSKTVPLFLPEEEEKKVSIPQDHPETVKEETKQKEQEKPEAEDSEVEQEPEVIVEREELTLENCKELYEKITEAAKIPEKSVVEVQGITSDVDWMNNEWENSKQFSGFLAADNATEYFVLTEYQAVEQVDRILVTFADGKMVDAHFQKRDPGTGLAVLKISKEEMEQETRKNVQVAELGSSYNIKQGEPVLALGSPAGIGKSLSFGMITSVENTKNTVDNEYHLLTTDIMGSSMGSGVLVSLDGKIIGVIVPSFSGEEHKNIVTALPISEVKGLIERLSNKEDLPYLGVRGQNIGSDLAQKTGLPKGIYVNAVEEDSPAMLAGIQNGDVIVQVKDQDVESLSELRREMDKYKPDQKIKVTAMRKGAEGYVEIVFDVIVGAV